MIPGMDAAAAVSPAVARQLGAQFVCRYLAPYPSQAWKLITPNELRDLHAAGIPVVFNWESDGTPGNGWGTGVDAAQQAQALLNDRATALGDPSIAQAPVIFTFADVDVAQANIPTLIDAHNGAASVLGLDRCGGYGGIGAITALFDAGAITFGWQTYAWSGGRWDPRAQLRQCANSLADGVPHDYDEAWADDYGQWPRPNQTPPTPKVADVEQPQIDQLNRIEALLAQGIGLDTAANPPTYDGKEWAGSPRQIATVARMQAELAATRAADCSRKLDAVLAALATAPVAPGAAVDVTAALKAALTTLTYTAKAGV